METERQVYEHNVNITEEVIRMFESEAPSNHDLLRSKQILKAFAGYDDKKLCDIENCAMKNTRHKSRLNRNIYCKDILNWYIYNDFMRIGVFPKLMSRKLNIFGAVIYCSDCCEIIQTTKTKRLWEEVSVGEKHSIGFSGIDIVINSLLESNNIHLLFKMTKTQNHLLKHYQQLKPLGELYIEKTGASMIKEIEEDVEDVFSPDQKKRKLNE